MSDRLLPDGSVLQVREGGFAMVAANLLHVLEGDGRHKAGGLPGLGDLGVELVDLFEGEALSLRGVRMSV